MSQFLLSAWQVCEFADTCQEQNCIGRKADRCGPLSCALRRAYLAVDEGGEIVDE
jgi:hypothetical protein